jgi:hypothetical protein
MSGIGAQILGTNIRGLVAATEASPVGERGVRRDEDRPP